MSDIFISYRRSTGKHLARSIRLALEKHNHNVFLDVKDIDNGPFDRVILNQIAARPHFLLILTSGALERCVNTDDWLRREIEEAFRLKRNIVPIYDDDFDINYEKQFLPEPIRTELPIINAPPFSHDYFDEFIQRINDRFLKLPIANSPIAPMPHAEVQNRIEQAAQQIEVAETQQPVSARTQAAKFEYELVPPTPSHPQMWGVENILPQPFEWVYIPEGTATLLMNIASQSFSVDTFNIAKYPITNAQFEVFIQAEDGYRNPRWWNFSDESRLWREKNQSSKPRAFPPNDHPRSNVNSYEATAFCNWLTERFNAHAPELPPVKITLPTSKQWVRASVSDNSYRFPWGNDFDPIRCNTKESGINQTTPVTQYPNGASPFGVMDMFGNVREWRLHSAREVLTGIYESSWNASFKGFRISNRRDNQDKGIGFRIVLMNS